MVVMEYQIENKISIDEFKSVFVNSTLGESTTRKLGWYNGKNVI